MGVAFEDRLAEPAGGFVVSEAAGEHGNALLVLDDGSVWRGLSSGIARPASGEVRITGSAVAVGEALIWGLDVRALDAHLAGRVPSRGCARGCITAPGATMKLHASVALAVARGEIGRP